MYDNSAAPPPYPLPAPWGAPAYPYAFPPGPPQLVQDDRRWLPVVSLVLAGSALVAVLILAAFLIGSGGSALLGGAEPALAGQVRDTPSAGALAGTSLSSSISDVIEHDFGHVTAMACPDTPTVKQGVVTVCHGAIDGDDWAAVVFFEDRDGVFTLQLL